MNFEIQESVYAAGVILSFSEESRRLSQDIVVNDFIALHKIPVAHVVNFFEMLDGLGIMARHDHRLAVFLGQ